MGVMVRATETAPTVAFEEHSAPELPRSALPALTWQATGQLETTQLLAVGQVGGSVWAFGVPWGMHSGLAAWEFGPGPEWHARGVVLDPSIDVRMVEISSGRVVAAGVDALPYRVEPAPAANDIVVLASFNGVDWTSHRLQPTVNGAKPAALIVTDDYALVLGEVGQVIVPTILDSLGSGWEDVLSDHAELVYLAVEDTWVRAYGPLGVVLGEWPSVALGITGSTGVTDVIAWRTTDFERWVPTAGVDVTRIDTTTTLSDGTVVIVGETPRGRGTLTSRDGLTWVNHDPPPRPGRVEAWGDRLVAVTDGFPEVFELVLGMWQPLTGDAMLPLGAYGDVVGAAGGTAGFAAMMGGPEWRMTREGDGTVASDEGALVIAGRGRSVVLIDETGEVLYQHSSFVERGKPALRLDPSSQLLSVTDQFGEVEFSAPLGMFGPFASSPVPAADRAGVGGHFVISVDGVSWRAFSAETFGDPQGAPVPVFVDDQFVFAAAQSASAPAVTDRLGRPVEVLAPVEVWLGSAEPST